MTIGVGLLATDSKFNSVRPNHAILLSDTLGSFGDIFAHPRLHKMIIYPENGVYTTSANEIDKAAEFVPMMNQNIAGVPMMRRTYGDILQMMNASLFLYRQQRFQLEVLPDFRLPPEAFDPRISANQLPPKKERQIQECWLEFDMGFYLLVAAFDYAGQAHLFHIDSLGKVTYVSFPGFGAVGIAAAQTTFWLSHRAQRLGMSVRRSAYHAYEAKVLAEDSPHVNDHIDMLIANKDKYWFSSTHPMQGPDLGAGSPVTIADLREWFGTHRPRDTDDLD
ncbi:MAG: hypothetical protein WBF04_22645 [Candidatus Sulfotelmatobacter sp.]